MNRYFRFSITYLKNVWARLTSEKISNMLLKLNKLKK